MARILIIDDQEAFRRLNAELLKLDGHQVWTSGNGREALQIIQDESPEIVLLDLMMPGIDGFQVCRQIKSDPSTQSIIVIVITAMPNTQRLKVLQTGADEFVLKPILSSQLRELIKKYTKQKV